MGYSPCGCKESGTIERLIFTFYKELPRLLSGKRICLPVQQMQETWVQSLGQEDPLEEGMATHSSILSGDSRGQRNLAS